MYDYISIKLSNFKIYNYILLNIINKILKIRKFKKMYI